VTTVVFETHSTSEDNEAGVMTGWLPGRLSALGREQARELGERRGNDGIGAIYCSDLARAVETARIAFPDRDLLLDWRLRECNYGRLNGTPKAARGIDDRFPGGESWREAVARVARALDDVRGARVLVIGHVATRWALDHRVNGRALEDLATEDFAWLPGWEYELPASDPRLTRV
jgi:2,3-bisphosphoglycerate-dependent phosphoglycerate mutase